MKQTRVIYSNNGVLTDLSDDVEKYRTGVATIADFVGSEDAIYIGNVAPFNHLYFKFGTLNILPVNMSVKYWDGKSWFDVVEKRDRTDGFRQDGIVEWVPDRNRAWQRDNTNNNGNEKILGLGSVTIYDLYWIKITFNSNLTASTQLKYIGYLFSNDDDLISEYPDLVRTKVKEGFETGKQNWEEQHVRASEILIDDLIKKEVIWNKGQILHRQDYTLANICKVAEIIYAAFGDDFEDQMIKARQEYASRLDKKRFSVDLDGNGELTLGEVFNKAGFLGR